VLKSFKYKKFIQNLFEKMGYKITKIGTSSYPEYEPVQPEASYSPWNLDKEFLSTYKMIKNNTMVDIYRCYELWAILEQSKHLDGSIIEIGTWQGGTGALIATKAELCGISDTVYLCDTFSGVVNAGINDSEYRGGEHSDTSIDLVENFISKKMKLKNTKILKGIFPQETSHLIDKEEKFRFCHVDVDVYQSSKDVIDWIWDKIVIGGIIVFDDYGFYRTGGVRMFVDELRNCNDRKIIHNLNGHAIVIKIK